jgi:hypothetical protein
VERVIQTGAPVLREWSTVPASPLDRFRKSLGNEQLLRANSNQS